MSNKTKEALEILNTLDNLITERIEELHKVQGMQQARHCYMFYRNLLWDIKEKLRKDEQ